MCMEKKWYFYLKKVSFIAHTRNDRVKNLNFCLKLCILVLPFISVNTLYIYIIYVCMFELCLSSSKTVRR